VTGDAAARDFVLALGRGLHSHGYPAHRLEETLTLVSRTLGLTGQFFSMPTALFASFGAGDEQRTFQIRVEPGDVDLGRLAAIDAIATSVARGKLTPSQGSAGLDQAMAAPPPYGPGLTTVAFALTSGAAARFFGGGLTEIVASTVIGCVIGVVAVVAARYRTVGRIFAPLAAACAAALAGLAARVAPVSVYTATVAGLIVLIPGFSLTVAMIELATRNLVSGTARLAGALGTFLAIGFGVALGTRVVVAFLGRPPRATVPVPLPEWTLFAALLLAPLGFTVLLRARPQDTLWITLSGALAFSGSRGGSIFLGPELGAFAGALVVGVASNAYARAFNRPEVVPLVPGMLLLVPGSLGFQSFASLLERNTVSGVEAAFRMTLVAVSLATGLLFANVVLPARRPPRAGEAAA
jgi:uncharacterized membrane protein YjjP (DUF1212 family)